jgi:phosphoribosylanthranilate isomerase
MRPEDAIIAAEAGADAIGINFYSKAKRSVDVETARKIIEVLPPFVTPVGLFVNATAQEVQNIAEDLRLRHVQLHGDETPEMVARLDSYVVLKAIGTDRDTLPKELAMWKAAKLPQLRGLLLETPNTGVPGGSGIENDWQMIAEFQRAGLFAGGPSIIAAGGLNPGNVAKVIHLLNPWGVDVSSGVEKSFGQKSPEIIRAFVKQVQFADEI